MTGRVSIAFAYLITRRGNNQYVMLIEGPGQTPFTVGILCLGLLCLTPLFDIFCLLNIRNRPGIPCR